METIGFPLNVELLMHYHCTPEPHPMIFLPPWKEATNGLVEMEAIYADDEGIYRTTELGKAWVAAICNTPPPKQGWVDHRDNILKV